MENNVVTSPKFNGKRPKRYKQFTTEEINSKIEQETRLATHKLKLFFINNCVWIVPLCVVAAVVLIVDLYAVLFIWKNPSVLFVQIKTIGGWIVSYILGLYTDLIRNTITKY